MTRDQQQELLAALSAASDAVGRVLRLEPLLCRERGRMEMARTMIDRTSADIAAQPTTDQT